jgi:uncharacterized repeat protein (TIGR03843 family)
VLAHSDHPRIQLLAALDLVINNADRKGGHVLHGTDDEIYGVDHGICLHWEYKLRTVLWGWVGEPLPAEVLESLHLLRSALEGDLATQLGQHITRREIQALRTRLDNLLADPVHPRPNAEWRAIPWPAF